MEVAVPVEDLVRAIDVDYCDGVPDDALIAARSRRDEVIPHLIALIRRDTELVRSGQEPLPTSGFYGALFLLTEFKASEALPAILDSLSLPGELPFELYGDILTHDISSVLAQLADQAVIDRMIGDRSLNEYVRWEAMQVLLHFVRDGLMTRDEAVARLRSHLNNALANDDKEAMYGLVSELYAYAPGEAMPELRQAFARYLHDEIGFSLKHIEDSLDEPGRHIQKYLRRCEPTGCPDAVATLHKWFDDMSSEEDPMSESAEDEEWEQLDEEFGIGPDESVEDSASTIYRPKAKVGRNDPCPCGSEKKHKKCCGRGQ